MVNNLFYVYHNEGFSIKKIANLGYNNHFVHKFNMILSSTFILSIERWRVVAISILANMA